MIVDSSHDIMIFALSVACGIADGIFFDFFRAMRRVFNHGKNIVAVQDTIFCFVVFVLFSYVITTFNDGRVRWYEFAGAILGAVLYFCFVSRNVVKVFVAGLNIVKKIFDKVCCFFMETSNRCKRNFSRLRQNSEKIYAKWYKRIANFKNKKKK